MIGIQRYQMWVLSLAALTILFFNLYGRYVPVSPELLSDTEFNLSSSQWTYSNTDIVSSANGVIRLHSDNYSTNTYITQVLPTLKHNKLLRLSADTKTSHVSRGLQPWMSARITLLSIKHDGTPIYSIPHNLVNLYDSHDWSHYSNVFRVPEIASKISISA
jgi:hypothetical protein